MSCFQNKRMESPFERKLHSSTLGIIGRMDSRAERMDWPIGIAARLYASERITLLRKRSTAIYLGW